MFLSKFSPILLDSLRNLRHYLQEMNHWSPGGERCRKRKCLTIFLKGRVRVIVNQTTRTVSKAMLGKLMSTCGLFWAHSNPFLNWTEEVPNGTGSRQGSQLGLGSRQGSLLGLGSRQGSLLGLGSRQDWILDRAARQDWVVDRAARQDWVVDMAAS